MNFRITILGRYPLDPMPVGVRVALVEEIEAHAKAYGCAVLVEFAPEPREPS
jgi:hypothetical protein